MEHFRGSNWGLKLLHFGGKMRGIVSILRAPNGAYFSGREGDFKNHAPLGLFRRRAVEVEELLYWRAPSFWGLRSAFLRGSALFSAGLG